MHSEQTPPLRNLDPDSNAEFLLFESLKQEVMQLKREAEMYRFMRWLEVRQEKRLQDLLLTMAWDMLILEEHQFDEVVREEMVKYENKLTATNSADQTSSSGSDSAGQQGKRALPWNARG